MLKCLGKKMRWNTRCLDGRMTRTMALAILSVWLWSSPGFGEDAGMKSGEHSQQSTRLSELIHQAVERNPGIERARAEWRAAIENFRVVTGMPDPQLMVTYFPDPIETRLGPQDWNASLTLPIPFPGVLTSRGKVAQAEAEAARLKLDTAIRDVVVSVRESVHELAYIRKARRVAQANSELLDHMRKIAETAHADNRTALVDVVRAQSQTGQIRYDALLLEELEQAEIANLNALLDREPGTPVGSLEDAPVSPLLFGLEEIYTMAESHREEIRMAEVMIEKASAGVELARRENRPEFRAGVLYSNIGDPDVASPPPRAGEDAFGVQFGVSIPLWLEKNKGRTARAQARLDEARADHRNRINDTRASIRRLYFQLTTAERTLRLYEDELLPQAAQSMTLAETWFREGQSSFSDFIEAQAVWYNFNLAVARARADYGKHLARLEKTVGRSLTHPAAETNLEYPGEGS